MEGWCCGAGILPVRLGMPWRGAAPSQAGQRLQGRQDGVHPGPLSQPPSPLPFFLHSATAEAWRRPPDRPCPPLCRWLLDSLGSTASCGSPWGQECRGAAGPAPPIRAVTESPSLGGARRDRKGPDTDPPPAVQPSESTGNTYVHTSTREHICELTHQSHAVTHSHTHTFTAHVHTHTLMLHTHTHSQAHTGSPAPNGHSSLFPHSRPCSHTCTPTYSGLQRCPTPPTPGQAGGRGQRHFHHMIALGDSQARPHQSPA